MTSRSRTRPAGRAAGALAALAGLALLPGCGAEFQPRSLVEDLRVLAVLATAPESGAPRLELSPGERITLTPYRLPPPGVAPAELQERWSFCPYSLGSRAGYVCAVPQCEVELATGATVDAQLGLAVTADPTALVTECLQRLAATGELPPGVPATLPDRVDLLFRYTLTSPRAANTPDGLTRTAVERVTFFPGGAPAPRNRPPELACALVGGVRVAGPAGCAPEGPLPALRRGGRLEIRVQLTPESAETYVDATGSTIEETLVISFYATAGRFEDDRANGPDGASVLKGDLIPEGAAAAQVWAVASDLRNGVLVLGPWTLPVTGP